MTDLEAHHYGVSVTDLDCVVGFYRDALGFDVIEEYTLSGDDLAAAIGADNATGHFVHLDTGGTRIELVEYDMNGNDRTGGNVHDQGATHIGLEIEDIDEFYEALPESVETISEPRTTESGTRIVFLRDPDGNPVELLEA